MGRKLTVESLTLQSLGIKSHETVSIDLALVGGASNGPQTTQIDTCADQNANQAANNTEANNN